LLSNLGKRISGQDTKCLLASAFASLPYVILSLS